ncbi:glucosaminidase domain-containing protein [Capnocytophaga leadbetteri]|uniref:glycoside hydrolase family 73 protein n=1 Tax=Capnocytophaga leadbetteri TaxID=327575 RepID=UPI0028F03A83|nr:glucosaminidase domain-containing protein [Capnocytophaga leadbetteri]
METIVQDFKLKYKDAALAVEEATGISHLFILAQAALESGWGQHAPRNMFFGVKASRNSSEADRQLLLTTEILSAPPAVGQFPAIISVRLRPDGRYECIVKDWFRAYPSPEACFADHAQFFFKHKRYAKALAVRADPYKFAIAVAQAGYATDPAYAQKLCRLISRLVDLPICR